MNTLIIGGSRGIGWELALLYAKAGDTVTVTGRRAPDQPHQGITFHKLDLSTANYIEQLGKLINGLPHIDRFVHSAGYYQEGRVTDLSAAEIIDMVQVCGTSVIIAARDILLRQNELAECIVVTSSSQWIARELEPIYNFAKAGAGHFAHALSQDKRVGKVLVAGPTGTDTAFHAARDIDKSTYHQPDWMARQIHDQAQGSYTYKFVKILRDPARIEVTAQE